MNPATHPSRLTRSLMITTIIGLLLSSWTVAATPAGTSSDDPVAGIVAEPLQAVSMEEKLDAQFPLDIPLVDSDGRTVTTGELLDGKRPVILNFVYFECPMLCGLVSGAMVNGLRDLEWTAGDDFIILTISIDHEETTALAAANKKTWLQAYGREGAGDRWYFLTGEAKNVKALAEATGFHYRYDELTKEYYHPSGLIVLTPEGHVSRYLSRFEGMKFDPATLRLSLSEAADGKIGSVSERVVDHFFLTCSTFDPERGVYTASAMKIMRMGGGLVALILAGFITFLMVKASRRNKAADPQTSTT